MSKNLQILRIWSLSLLGFLPTVLSLTCTRSLGTSGGSGGTCLAGNDESCFRMERIFENGQKMITQDCGKDNTKSQRLCSYQSVCNDKDLCNTDVSYTSFNSMVKSRRCQCSGDSMCNSQNQCSLSVSSDKAAICTTDRSSIGTITQKCTQTSKDMNVAVKMSICRCSTDFCNNVENGNSGKNIGIFILHIILIVVFGLTVTYFSII